MIYKRSKYFKTSKKRKINYFFSDKKSPIIVVFFHGFMSDMYGKKPEEIGNFCKKQKLSYLKFEYSGHGQSSGKFTQGNISKWTDDAKQLIKSKINKKNKLIFLGSSMGSWICLNLFSKFKKQIKGFIGIASAPEFLEKLMWNKFSPKIRKIIWKEKIYYVKSGDFVYPITKQLIKDGRKNKVLNNKINLNIPITLFHGSKDKVVPINFSKKILKVCKKAQKKIITIKDGDHSLSRKKDLKKICRELGNIAFNCI
jgi:uncharacterized protein